MRYFFSTPEQEREMLQAIGVDSFEELIQIVPDELRVKGELGLDAPVSELELQQEAEALSNANRPSCINTCFLGGGAYDHFIPQVVDFITSRSEFYTAYTPYQAEVSQGTLQAMYEFQTMICQLSGMDVANASLYDGGSAVAEACSLALSAARKKKILISETVNPRYREIAATYLQNREAELVVIPHTDGMTDLNALEKHLPDAACAVIQSPNYFGLVEDWSAVRGIIPDKAKTLLVAVSDPTTLQLLESPGKSGADIYVGEGQVLGNTMSYGGPYLGLMAVKSKLVRKMPGRIIGRTEDRQGRQGFVLTLQTREQHIRRENATSNICTNQGLMALRATVYLALMGRTQLRKLAELCFHKTQYALSRIAELENYHLPYGNRCLKEFVVEVPGSAKKLVQQAEREGIFFSTVSTDASDRQILIAVTEKRSKSDIHTLTDFLARSA